jgi:hypothetical protein
MRDLVLVSRSSFLDANSDKDLLTGIMSICNNIMVTTLNNTSMSVQAQHIGLLATVACHLSPSREEAVAAAEVETLVVTRTSRNE